MRGNARLKRGEFNAMQLFRVARRTMRKCSQSNFETIQNTEVTRVGVTCRVRARFTSRSRQILLDLVVSPDYSVRTCLQLCRSYELCYCLRKSGRNQQTLAFTGIIIYCEVVTKDTKQIAMLTLLKYYIIDENIVRFLLLFCFNF